uniref:Nuclease harbi1 n=1 Tax=Triatoma infestans TaxID=30076 RepID=A0A170VYG5_TRIIF
MVHNSYYFNYNIHLALS